MKNKSNCQLKLNLSFEEVNGVMDVRINDSLVTHVDNKAEVLIDIELPSTITIELSGKGPNDTIVNEGENGSWEIIKDKHVNINSIYLDCFKISDSFLFHNVILKANDKTITGPYLGENGTATIKFEKSSVLEQIITTER